MSNGFDKILAKVRYEYSLTDSQIAEAIGRDRSHLSRAKSKGGTRILLSLLREKFPDAFKEENQDVTVLSLLHVALDEIAELKSAVTGADLQEIRREIDRKLGERLQAGIDDASGM